MKTARSALHEKVLGTKKRGVVRMLLHLLPGYGRGGSLEQLQWNPYKSTLTDEERLSQTSREQKTIISFHLLITAAVCIHDCTLKSTW